MTGVQDGAEALRHKQKMAKRKAAQDAEVAAKTITQKGLLIVHTGKGNIDRGFRAFAARARAFSQNRIRRHACPARSRLSPLVLSSAS